MIAKVLSTVESESNNVGKKIHKRPVKNECTNEASKKQFTTWKKNLTLANLKLKTLKLNPTDLQLLQIATSLLVRFNLCQQIGEPIMANPNSFDRFKHILHEYKILNNIGLDIEYVILGFDGPPFRMASIYHYAKKKHQNATLKI